MKTVFPRPLLWTLALAIASYVVTHFMPIPGGLREVMEAGRGPLLDQRASFSTEETYARLAAFGEEGRRLYRGFTLSTDLIFPLTWMPFLLIYARFAASRTHAPHALELVLVAAPFVYFVADVVENVFIWIMIGDFPMPHPILAAMIGYPTQLKWVGLMFALIVPTALLMTHRVRAHLRRTQA